MWGAHTNIKNVKNDGSSAIFKFIYEYRPPPLTQIGLINGIRVSLGQDENGRECGNNVTLDDGTS